MIKVREGFKLPSIALEVQAFLTALKKMYLSGSGLEYFGQKMWFKWINERAFLNEQEIKPQFQILKVSLETLQADAKSRPSQSPRAGVGSRGGSSGLLRLLRSTQTRVKANGVAKSK